MPMEQVSRSRAIDRATFHARLRGWCNLNSEYQIGDAAFGQTTWLYVTDGGSVYRLNADTKRDGVAEYLKLVDLCGDELAWQVVPNQRGNENAVAFGPEAVRLA